MTKHVSTVGTFGCTPAEGAQDARFSIAFQLNYTQKAEDELTFASPVTNRAVDLGTMTAPKAIYLECLEGAFTLKLNSGDTGVLGFGLAATPASTDKSYMLWVNPTGAAVTLYLTVAAAAKVKIMIFQ